MTVSELIAALSNAPLDMEVRVIGEQAEQMSVDLVFIGQDEKQVLISPSNIGTYLVLETGDTVLSKV